MMKTHGLSLSASNMNDRMTFVTEGSHDLKRWYRRGPRSKADFRFIRFVLVYLDGREPFVHSTLTKKGSPMAKAKAKSKTQKSAKKAASKSMKKMC